MFVDPHFVTLSSAFGYSAAGLAADVRVTARLGNEWLESVWRV